MVGVSWDKIKVQPTQGDSEEKKEDGQTLYHQDVQMANRRATLVLNGKCKTFDELRKERIQEEGESVALLQAVLLGHKTRQAFMSEAKVIYIKDGEYGERLVHLPWLPRCLPVLKEHDGGLLLFSKGDILAENTDNHDIRNFLPPAELHVGMSLHEIQGIPTKGMTTEEMKIRLETNTLRPIDLSFKSGPEHAFFTFLLTQFNSFDQDGSGALEKEEVKHAIGALYKANRFSRRKSIVDAEV